MGGLLLGIPIFFFPPLYGEGYDSVELLLQGRAAELARYAPIVLALGPWNIVLLTLALTLFKVLAVSFTVHSGGNGGMFGPSLFIGGMLGFTLAHALNLSGYIEVNEVNFTVVGMAAMLSGTIHVPLTAIFLIAEIAGVRPLRAVDDRGLHLLPRLALHGTDLRLWNAPTGGGERRTAPLRAPSRPRRFHQSATDNGQ